MILDQIVEHKKTELHEYNVDKAILQKTNFNFLAAFKKNGFNIIGELKSQSPSEGIIKHDYDPVKIAKQYEQGGAAALSILTDKKFFGGRFSDIENVKKECPLPILCKDFIIDICQIHRARLAGADACLLIVRILSDEQLSLLHHEIESLGMNALVEIFDEQDLKRALQVNPKIIGINNRNLDTLAMNTNNAESLKQLIPEHILTFSLSGAKTPEDIRNTLKEVDGVLVGTALMKAQDPENFLKEV